MEKDYEKKYKEFGGVEKTPDGKFIEYSFDLVGSRGTMKARLINKCGVEKLAEIPVDSPEINIPEIRKELKRKLDLEI